MGIATSVRGIEGIVLKACSEVDSDDDDEIAAKRARGRKRLSPAEEIKYLESLQQLAAMAGGIVATIGGDRTSNESQEQRPPMEARVVMSALRLVRQDTATVALDVAEVIEGGKRAIQQRRIGQRP